MIAQATISLLNLGARKLAPAEQRGRRRARRPDLEQVRDAIDAARALMAVLERRIPQELPPLRDALSRLQMTYAQEVQRPPPQRSPPASRAEAARPGPGEGGAPASRGRRGPAVGRPARRFRRRPGGAARPSSRPGSHRGARAGRVQRASVGARQISLQRGLRDPWSGVDGAAR